MCTNRLGKKRQKGLYKSLLGTRKRCDKYIKKTQKAYIEEIIPFKMYTYESKYRRKKYILTYAK